MLILFLWSLYETINWYKGGIIYYGDQGVYLYKNVDNYLFSYYSPLTLYTYPGIPNGLLFNPFYLIMYAFSVISLKYNEELLNLVFLFISAVGFFFMINKIIENILIILRKYVNIFYIMTISLISAVFYISNWSIVEAPTFVPLYQEFLIYAILPWILYLLIKIFEKKDMNYILILLVSIFIAIILIEGNYSYLEQSVFVIMIFLLYSVFLIKRNEHVSRKIITKKILLLFFNVMLLIFFMLFFLYQTIKSTLIPSFITTSQYFFAGNSSINYFYLALMDLGQGGSSLHYAYPGITITIGLFIIFIAYAVTLEYVAIKHNKMLIANLAIFLVPSIIFVALYSGTNKSSPFYTIIHFLFYHYTIFTEFRTNAFAVSFYYAFFLGILIGLGVLFSLFAIKNKKVIVIALIAIFILVNIMYPLPVITGEYNSDSAHVEIPNYVNDAYNFTNHLNGKNSILLIPQSFLWSYTDYYTGVNMLEYESKDPVITGSAYQDRYNNYSNILYKDYCNVTDIIHNQNFNKSNLQYLHNILYIMDVKYIYFQNNIKNTNESKYNVSLNYLYKNNIMLTNKYIFGNITIYKTNINSSFLLGTNNTDINNILKNNTEMQTLNISNILNPMKYTMNRYSDNINVKDANFKIILLTLAYSNFNLIGYQHSSILWFNEFKDKSNNTVNNLEITYKDSNIKNQRLYFFAGITIYIIELSFFISIPIIKKIKLKK